ncbi:MAG TPA: hypothetical protein VMF90_13780 [Rhizobiaceae bacterium]|nr:hypothetical protein [Rhizobiaceae bacterium]
MAALLFAPGLPALAQQDPAAISLPGITSYAPATEDGPLATAGGSEVTLAAQLTGEAGDVSRGLVWRIFRPEPGPDGKLPLVASAQGGTQVFSLAPGSYLVHATFGRAGATKRITVGAEAKREAVVLDAGGLKLDAILSNGRRIPAAKLRFSIYEADGEDGGALIIPDVKPNAVVRLNSGTYHVVSTYGNVNAVIRSDIKVDAGKLTEATVEHHAAEVTFKLVRESGGEAIADTSWSIVTDSGDPIRESVGAYASLVLAEGNYTIIAKNRDRIYQREYTVEGGRDQEVEVLTTEAQVQPVDGDIID